MNLVVLHDPLFVFRQFCPSSESRKGQINGTQKGEKLDFTIQTLRDNIFFQQQCRSQNSIGPFGLFGSSVVTPYLVPESLPELVSSVDAG